ncbi:sugar-binding transcriptional regulator [Arthrobacter zhaoxinii]|uniref:sugar-binding transcriptional regulator n=1 Tax=Arthrobacter zhaoxinii TaxID=2964616 RepID=UPI0021032C36|nr:sugar-binding domain-containing protein [Arthrobacter zhaoxinii]MCQ2000699.1 sugar-binding transcriptional regulator [Arthrobacter zhaoxinii]
MTPPIDPVSLSMASPDQLRLLTKIAVLYHEERLAQADISSRLNLSQARVSRCLKLAADLGIVRTSVVQPPGIYVGLEKALEEKYGLREVVVADMVNDASLGMRLGSCAATYLETTIEVDDVVGISSWSTTLLQTVEAMRSRPRKVLSQVIQMIGGVGSPQAQIQATRLVSHLAELTSAKPFYMAAPGLVANHEIRQAFLADPAVASTAEAWNRVNTSLVGIGTFPASPLWQASGNALTPHEEKALLDSGAVGEICLRYFDIDGAPMNSAIEERMVSINSEAMLRIPRRIGVAGGMRKLDAIRGAISGGWVNVLITDSEVARQLLEPPRLT